MADETATGENAMKRDQIKRRVLYGTTAAAWTVAGYYLYLDLHAPEASEHRTLMIYTLTVAAVLSTTSLFVWFIPTSDAIYRSGIDAGRRMHECECSSTRPILTAVDGRRAGGATVTAIRTRHTNS